MKARLRPDGGVANPRNTFGYCCGLRLALGPNPSLSSCSETSAPQYQVSRVGRPGWNHMEPSHDGLRFGGGRRVDAAGVVNAEVPGCDGALEQCNAELVRLESGPVVNSVDQRVRVGLQQLRPLAGAIVAVTHDVRGTVAKVDERLIGKSRERHGLGCHHFACPTVGHLVARDADIGIPPVCPCWPGRPSPSSMSQGRRRNRERRSARRSPGSGCSHSGCSRPHWLPTDRCRASRCGALFGA